MAASFVTKAYDKAFKEAFREGRIEGWKETVLGLARIRFGRIPRIVRQRVKAATDEDELSRLMAEIANAKSPSDLDLKE